MYLCSNLFLQMVCLGDWSKRIGELGVGVEPEQRSYPCGCVILGFFLTAIGTFHIIQNRGNSFQFQKMKTFWAVVEKVQLGSVQ